jgi:prepilin-type N-terminal cleavage/methylation domain-containing protein
MTLRRAQAQEFDCARTSATRSRHSAQSGFSLLEMLVSIAILLVIMGSTLSLMNSQQRSTQSVESKADVYESLRGATELMTQEIGQAGLVSLPGVTSSPPVAQPTLTQAVSASAVPQNVLITTNMADSMFVGEKLLIDTAASEELVTLTAVNASSDQIAAVFTNPHAIGAIVKVFGTFPNGVMNTSDASHLKLLGDINSNGTLAYAEYDCNPNATGTGTLTRSITTVTPLTVTANASDPLLTNLLSNPGGTPCFTYTTQTVNVSGVPTTFVTNVAITLSVQATHPDEQTGLPVTMTKSLLNVAPRNVLMGWELANDVPPVTDRLQATPVNVASW